MYTGWVIIQRKNYASCIFSAMYCDDKNNNSKWKTPSLR